MKPFRIFKPGTHTASCGTAVTFTEADLKRAVSAYDPQLYAAPLVIGHPKQEDRAYGWAESLSYEDGYVVAHPDKVEPTFSELVEQGAYRNRSASWYMPDHPSNPSPGNLYPKHIGFLGAVPPSLKGLGDVQFSEGAQPVDFTAPDPRPDLVLEFADASDDAWSLASFMSSTARMLRGFRDTLIGDKGLEEADKTLPSYQIEDLERQAASQQEKARAMDKGGLPSFTETPNPGDTDMTPEQIAALQAKADQADALQAQVNGFAERENALKAAEIMATVASIDASLDPLVKAGKVLPAQRKALASFMATLDDKEQVVEFGEPVDGKQPKVSNRQFMREFLGKLPKSVDYSDRSTSTAANSGALTPVQLAEKATDLRNKIKTDTGRDISFTEATNRVLAEAGVTVEDTSGEAQV